MSESTQEMLTAQVEANADDIREYARQIESGTYGNRWTVTDHEGNERTVILSSDDEDEAIAQAQDGTALTAEQYDNWTAERDAFDEPTIVDADGNEMPIYEWPLEVVVKIGRPLAVVLSAGGPHVEIVQDMGDGRAKLAGYWGGEKVYRHGDEMQTVLDYLTDALYEEAPEEYK